MRQAPTGPVLSTAPRSFGPMSRAAYDRLDALNYSRLKHMIESPLHMQSQPPFDPTPSTDFGNIVDEMLLGRLPNQGPGYMANPYPDFRTKEAREWRDKMNADGVIIANVFDIEKAKRLCNNIRSHAGTAKLIDASRKQHVIVAEINGVLCKGRADMVFEGRGGVAFPIDLKTADSITDNDIRRKILNFGYFIQAGMYSLLLEAHGYKVPNYRWLFAESDLPLDWRWKEFEADDLAFSKDFVIKMIDLYKACKEKNEWPGYSKKPTKIGFSEYAKRELGMVLN